MAGATASQAWEASPHRYVLRQALRLQALAYLLLPLWKHLRKRQEPCMARAASLTGEQAEWRGWGAARITDT